MTKGAWISYSAKELAWVQANATLPAPELHNQFCATFDRNDVSQSNIVALRKRNGWRTGRTGQFDPGTVPINKGKPMPDSVRAKVARTWFAKGNLPHNTKFSGHERVSIDGYVEISIDEPNHRTGFERRYVLKHKHLWEVANGPIPEGHCLKCLDGNRLNTSPANWEAIPRSLLPFLNGHRGHNYGSAPNELKPTILAIAKIKGAISLARKHRVSAP